MITVLLREWFPRPPSPVDRTKKELVMQSLDGATVRAVRDFSVVQAGQKDTPGHKIPAGTACCLERRLHFCWPWLFLKGTNNGMHEGVWQLLFQGGTIAIIKPKAQA